MIIRSWNLQKHWFGSLKGKDINTWIQLLWHFQTFSLCWHSQNRKRFCFMFITEVCIVLKCLFKGAVPLTYSFSIHVLGGDCNALHYSITSPLQPQWWAGRREQFEDDTFCSFHHFLTFYKLNHWLVCYVSVKKWLTAEKLLKIIISPLSKISSISQAKKAQRYKN